MSAGSGEQSLPRGNDRRTVFTQRGRQRGRLNGSLIQGVIVVLYRTFTSISWLRYQFDHKGQWVEFLNKLSNI